MPEPIPIARAEAVFNGDFFFIVTHSGYRSSVRDPLGAQVLLPPDSDDSSIGRGVLAVLSASRFVTPQQDLTLYDYRQVQSRYADWVKSMMKSFKYKSKTSLFKNMKNCGVECLNSTISIAPSHHEKLDGWSGQGISKDDYVIVSEQDAPETIGAALRKAFERCT